jgi:hypothetical protein
MKQRVCTQSLNPRLPLLSLGLQRERLKLEELLRIQAQALLGTILTFSKNPKVAQLVTNSVSKLTPN